MALAAGCPTATWEKVAPSEIERDARVGPFFQTMEPRREDREAAEHFPRPDQGDEVDGIAERNHAAHARTSLNEVREAQRRAVRGVGVTAGSRSGQ